MNPWQTTARGRSSLLEGRLSRLEPIPGGPPPSVPILAVCRWLDALPATDAERAAYERDLKRRLTQSRR